MSKTMAEVFEKELKIWDPAMLAMEHRNNAVTCHIFEKTVDLPKHSSQRECVAPRRCCTHPPCSLVALSLLTRVLARVPQTCHQGLFFGGGGCTLGCLDACG
jgi:hypothetical protein